MNVIIKKQKWLFPDLKFDEMVRIAEYHLKCRSLNKSVTFS